MKTSAARHCLLISVVVWGVVTALGAAITPRSHLYAMVDVDLFGIVGGVWGWGVIGFVAGCFAAGTTTFALTSPLLVRHTDIMRFTLALGLAGMVAVGILVFALTWITRKPPEFHSFGG